MEIKNTKIIDLTHTLSSDIPTWGGGCDFNLEMTLDYQDCTAPNLFRKHTIRESQSGVGTHMDAPAHCIPGGKTIDQLSLENLAVDCVVIKNLEAGEDYLFMPESIEAFEKMHGKIPENSFVLFCTGWDKYWGDPKKYRNDLKFPSIHEDTAKLLMERNIAGLGIDTLSPDAIGNDFPVHRVVLGAGKYLVENIAQAKDIPETGAKIFVAPIKIKGGSEAPIRLFALI